MKKLSKVIFITLGVIVALVVAAAFAVNLYIQSPGVQAMIQEEISRALRVPLRITNTTISPWGDLRITGISIPHDGTNLLEATAFRARYRVLPVFTGRLIIHEMSVENPKVVWAQNTEGKWVLPRAETAAATAATAAAAPAKSSTPETQKKEVASKKKRGFQVTVDGFEIRHGSVELLDTRRTRVALFTDVNMRYTSLTSERIAGVADIASISWAGLVTFEKVHTPFNYTPKSLDLPQLTGTLAGGSVVGSLTLQPDAPKSPFKLGFTFDHVDVATMTKGAGWGDGQATGSAAGTIELAGNFSEFARSEGNLKLTLADGRFREFAYFEMIGQALQIRQLSDLRLKESSATARIADEKLFFENISLQAADLQLTAKGLARFDGKLQFSARLTAQEALIRQLPGLVRENFAAGDDGTRSIDFNITGKTAKPKTDLLDKIVGKKLEDQFQDLVSGLFGKKKKDDYKKDAEKKKKKDKPDDQPAGAPIPPASASPAPPREPPAASPASPSDAQ